MKPVRSLVRNALGAQIGNKFRVWQWNARKRIYRNPILPQELRQVLTELGASRNRDLWFQSSWNEFYNLRAKPTEIIQMLQEIVGPNATIAMPAFPLIRDQSQPLLIDSAPVSTGLLAEIFRRTPGTSRSVHLRSSVSALGPESAPICQGHELTIYSWGPGTPYDALRQRDAMMIIAGFTPMGFTPLHWVECILHAEGNGIPGAFGGMVRYIWRRNNGESGVHEFLDRIGVIRPRNLIKHFDSDLFRRRRISNLELCSLPAMHGLDHALQIARHGVNIYNRSTWFG